MISLQNVYKAFGSHQVLNGFSLEVREGETMVIIGYSGTGKSVAIKHIVGLLEPDKGTVFVDDLEVPASSSAANSTRSARTSAMSSSSPRCSILLTVNENVSMGLVKAGTFTPLKEIALARVQEALELVDLPDAGPDVTHRALRRHAQARRHRARHRPPPEIHTVRRADHRPRSRHGRGDRPSS